MKVYIHTNGCAVLKHETERIASFFLLNDVEIAGRPEDCDIVVMTCCGVTHNEENQAIDIIADLYHRKQKGAAFVVGGCLPSFARERILQAAPDARLMTYSQMGDFDTMIPTKISWKDVYYNHGHMMRQEEHRDDTVDSAALDDDFRLAQKVDSMNGTGNCIRQYDLCTLRRYIWQGDDVYQVKVAYGCPGQCSYCATKLAIGKFRSVPKSLVIKQFREGVEAGFRRFCLMGDEIGCYGTDFGENIVMLLDDIYAVSKEITVSIRYIHPDLFVRYYDGLKPYLMNGFVDFFCCAIQSGSPKMLAAMNRNPDIESFVSCMEDLKREGCKVNKHTQILIGYPGETEADMWQTLNTLIRCDFDHININKFSRRRGTPAYGLEETVAEEDKIARCALIREIMYMGKKAKLYEAIKSSYFHD